MKFIYGIFIELQIVHLCSFCRLNRKKSYIRTYDCNRFFFFLGDQAGRMISGWLPVYDTMHGIRGEVNLIVKVELFSDLNKFRESSCGVKFFFSK